MGSISMAAGTVANSAFLVLKKKVFVISGDHQGTKIIKYYDATYDPSCMGFCPFWYHLIQNKPLL